MNIASITCYCNEKFRLKEWVKYSKKYIDSIRLHIIVNNGKPEDRDYLNEYFPNSIIINSNNKSLTNAINRGIRYALKDDKIDTILLIANDFTSTNDDIKKLYDFLQSDNYSVVAPVVLQKDSNLIEAYGQTIKRYTLRFYGNFKNIDIKDKSIPDKLIVNTVPGGFNLSRRKYYEDVGLQDESLEMYADEIDNGIRAQKYNKIIAVTKSVVSHHQHTLPKGKKYRNRMAGFYVGRNYVFLAKKHYGLLTVMICTVSQLTTGSKVLIGDIVKLRGWDKLVYRIYFFIGIFSGLINKR